MNSDYYDHHIYWRRIVQREGLYYPVVFCDKLRKYFAPLNGEIKPDTLHVRGLLKQAGWL